MNQNIVVDAHAEASIEDALLAPILAGIPGGFFVDDNDARAAYLPARGQDYAVLAGRHAFSNLAAQARALRAIFVDADGWPIDVAISGGQIPRMLSAGLTIAAMGMVRTGRLGRFLDACGAAAPGAGRFHCNAFLSPAGAAFGMRIDPRPTLILQLAGCKRWRFVAQPEHMGVQVGIALPPGSSMLDLPWGRLHRPTPERMEEVTLEPGDVLYLPTGCWHEGSNPGESFSLSIATSAPPPLEAFKKAIADGVGSTSASMPMDADAGHGWPAPGESFHIVTGGMCMRDVRAAWHGLLAQARGERA